jgi:peptidoglycan/LPS O-acetylase OafA/YrhL
LVERVPAIVSGAPSKLRLDVQGLRGLAVLLVVLFHVGLPPATGGNSLRLTNSTVLSGGFVGVDVFFVVSGFVITRLLWTEVETTGTLRLRLFYARRVRRLLPALALMLIVVAIVVPLIFTPLGVLEQTSITGAAAAFFSANAVIWYTSFGYFDPASGANPLLHTWTLAVEEQFYLFFPILMLFGWKMTQRLRLRHRGLVVPAVVLAVLGVSLTTCIFFTYKTGPPFGFTHNRMFAFYGSSSRAWEFAAGAIVAFAEPALRRYGTTIAQVCALFGLGLLATSVLMISADTAFPGIAALPPVLAVMCLIVSGSIRPNFVTSLLSKRGLTWLGDMSYGWYLWHWPALVFAQILYPSVPLTLLFLVAALSLLPAWLSYRFVENRIRFDRTIVGWRAFRVACVTCLIPASAFLLIWTAARSPQSSSVRDLQAQGQPHLDFTQGCINNLPDSDALSDCTWTTPQAKGTVLLIGDSNAGHFAEPVRGAAMSAGYNFQLATSGGCPFAALEVHYDFTFDTGRCNAFIKAWLSDVEREKPALVVLANDSNTYLVADNGISFVDPVTGKQSISGADKAAAWERGIREVVTRWNRQSVPVLLVHAVPQFPPYDLRLCPVFKVYAHPAECGPTVPATTLVSLGAVANAAENNAVGSAPLAHAMNFFEEVCSEPQCSTYRAGQFLYLDQDHISVPFARSLQPKFAGVMDAFLK